MRLEIHRYFGRSVVRSQPKSRSVFRYRRRHRVSTSVGQNTPRTTCIFSRSVRNVCHIGFCRSKRINYFAFGIGVRLYTGGKTVRRAHSTKSSDFVYRVVSTGLNTRISIYLVEKIQRARDSVVALLAAKLAFRILPRTAFSTSSTFVCSSLFNDCFSESNPNY